MIWSLCASVDEDGRKKIDNYIREMEGIFPNKDTIYEYFVDSKTKTFAHWEERLRIGWKFNSTLVILINSVLKGTHEYDVWKKPQ